MSNTAAALAKEKLMQGATVWCRVSDVCRGEFLHRLEHYADVHIVRVEDVPQEARSIFHLRSDRWPDWWDGVEVFVILWSDFPQRMQFEPHLSCKLNYALRDEIAALLAKALAQGGGGAK